MGAIQGDTRSLDFEVHPSRFRFHLNSCQESPLEENAEPPPLATYQRLAECKLQSMGATQELLKGLYGGRERERERERYIYIHTYVCIYTYTV